MDIPVYLFTGFLESGKTKFIQETLEDERFNAGEKTLLLLCEEGLEEYEPDKFSGHNVYIETVDSQDDLTTSYLDGLIKQTKSVRVIIEYNGMWTLDKLFNAMPQKWIIYQQMMFADSTTFPSYNANMRSLVYDKLKSAELVIFNRVSENTDKMELHKIVRGISRQNAIIYEYIDGSTEQDTIEDPLPFDINADIINIEDRDYALLYRDMMEELNKYGGKVVKFKGIAAKDKKLDNDTFIIGRHVMTCCADDIQFLGVPCKYGNAKLLTPREWVTVRATISIETHSVYQGERGPVLTTLSVEKAEPADPDVATF